MGSSLAIAVVLDLSRPAHGGHYPAPIAIQPARYLRAQTCSGLHPQLESIAQQPAYGPLSCQGLWPVLAAAL